ncbi:hypothetical protein HRO26_00970 [Treponema pectinovorum]|uniref:glycosyltransferase n=1 Tax=Treponema pectinovorum TaxID=164 RepID=UPI003D919080
MINFKHIIITQFNIPLKKDDADNKQAKGIQQDYLNNRLEIFEKYCLPSVEKQTCKNFTWLILFSENTPSYIRTRIDEYVERCPQIIPCYFNFHDFDDSKKTYPSWILEKAEKYHNTMKKHFSNYVPDEFAEVERIIQPLYLNYLFTKYVPDETEVLVTSRIDNDDSVNINFVKTIQEKLQEINDTDYILNFLYGYQKDLNKGLLQKYYYPNNHFSTYVSRYNKNYNDTVYTWEHGRIFLYKKVINIKTFPMWIEYIHKTNVVNRLRLTWKSKPCFSIKNYEDFGYDSPILCNKKAELKLIFSWNFIYSMISSFILSILSKLKK